MNLQDHQVMKLQDCQVMKLQYYFIVGLSSNASTITARNETLSIFISLIEVQSTLVAASDTINEEQFALNLVDSLISQVPRQFKVHNFINVLRKYSTKIRSKFIEIEQLNQAYDSFKQRMSNDVTFRKIGGITSVGDGSVQEKVEQAMGVVLEMAGGTEQKIASSKKKEKIAREIAAAAHDVTREEHRESHCDEGGERDDCQRTRQRKQRETEARQREERSVQEELR